MNKLITVAFLLYISITITIAQDQIVSIKSYQYNTQCSDGNIHIGDDSSCVDSSLSNEVFYKLGACGLFQGGATTFTVDGNGEIKATTYSDQNCKIYQSTFRIPFETCIVDCNSTNPILATVILQNQINIPTNSFSHITYLGDECGVYKNDFTTIQYTITGQCLNTKGGSSSIYSCNDQTVSGKFFQQHNCTSLSGSSSTTTGNSCLQGTTFSVTICNQQ